MKPRSRKLLALPGALLLGFALWACEQAPTAIEPQIVPSEASLARGSSSGLSKLTGVVPTFALEEEIGAEGGSIGVPGFMLTVPKGAVSGPTTFRFASVGNGYVQVKATATSVGSAQENDVGAAGFSVPLSLAIAYSPAGGAPQWGRLLIAWVRPDGVLESIPSRNNIAAKVVTGKVSHFSDYALAWPY